jgi:DNA-binding CsgD family transcriptional regulator
MSSVEEKSYAAIRVVVRDSQRLAALRITELLHSQSEVFFDRLVRIAAEVAQAPAAFLSLVEEDFDFYKSSYGFDEALTSSREMRGETFCHHALVSDGPLVIRDVRDHPVFRLVPTVRSMNVVAYLGVPLTVHGQPVGAFCVIDHRPRAWNTEDVHAIATLARAANVEVSKRVRRRAPGAEEEAGETAAEENRPPPAVLQKLSRREMEVLSRILAGRGTKEIAVELEMSDKTVATHRGRLMRKLNLHSTRELFAFAVRQGLVDWLQET